jgi:hypothetical protein
LGAAPLPNGALATGVKGWLPERDEPKAEDLDGSARGVEGATGADWPKVIAGAAELANFEEPEKGLDREEGCAGSAGRAPPNENDEAENAGADGFCSGSSAWRFFLRLSSSSEEPLDGTAAAVPKDPKGFALI